MRRQLTNRGPVDYQVCRSNDQWADHRARTLVTAGLIAWMQPDYLLDPACGDGSIPLAAHRLHPIQTGVLSDISKPSIERIELPSGWLKGARSIEESIAFTEAPWDVVVLTETLEHLPDPDGILRTVRPRAKALVASSPAMRQGQVDPNPEHLWMFDESGYQEMLSDAGWEDVHHTVMRFPTMYDFQIWVCV